MCSRHHIFPAPLVVTITGHTYGCVRTPTRVAFHRPMTTRHTPPSRMDTEKARAPPAGPPARSDARMTAARRISRAGVIHPWASRRVTVPRVDAIDPRGARIRCVVFFCFFTRAFASIARANATSRVGLETARMDGWVDIISAGRAERGVRMDGMDDDGVARSRARMNERVDLIFLRVIREETSSRARLGARTRRDHDVPFIPSSVGRSIHPSHSSGDGCWRDREG